MQSQQEFDNEFAMTEMLQSHKPSTGSCASKPGNHRRYGSTFTLQLDYVGYLVYRPLQPLTRQYPPLAEQSSFNMTQDESSFVPYHDSMQESVASYARKPLQSLTLPQPRDESSSILYHDSVQQENVISSVRKQLQSLALTKNQDDSSFVPYHESMQEVLK